MPDPSGRQIRLSYDDQELTVVEVGGGIRTYTVGGEAVIDGYRRSETCPGGRGQVLAPWPNRLADGRFDWHGQTLQTALSEPEEGNAIHGLVRWARWTIADQSGERARMEYRLYPQPGWLWILDLSITYRLSGDGLEVRTSATNVASSAGPCPFGVGWHPYLWLFGGEVDDVLLTVPARTVYVSDGRGIPTGKKPSAGSDSDFLAARRVGDMKLDHCFTDLSRDSAGRAVVVVEPVDGSRRGVELWMDGNYGHVMVFSGDTLGEVDRRRRGLAVEPMTCAPNMLQSGDGLILLGEGQTFDAVWGLRRLG